MIINNYKNTTIKQYYLHLWVFMNVNSTLVDEKRPCTVVDQQSLGFAQNLLRGPSFLPRASSCTGHDDERVL